MITPNPPSPPIPLLTGLVTTETDIEVGDYSQVVASHQSEAGQTAALVENIQH